MPRPFDPNNWYWIVAGSTTQVYSSASGTFVPVNNATYQAWLVQGNAATNIGTEAEIGAILAQNIAILTTTTSTSLPIQQAIKQAQLDVILVANADVVKMVKAGQSQTTTGTAVANYLSNYTNNYRSLRAQIAAATTAAQVQAININAGWPSNP